MFAKCNDIILHFLYVFVLENCILYNILYKKLKIVKNSTFKLMLRTISIRTFIMDLNNFIYIILNKKNSTNTHWQKLEMYVDVIQGALEFDVVEQQLRSFQDLPTQLFVLCDCKKYFACSNCYLQLIFIGQKNSCTSFYAHFANKSCELMSIHNNIAAKDILLQTPPRNLHYNSDKKLILHFLSFIYSKKLIIIRCL